MKGPEPERASTRSAAVRAATNDSNSGATTATSTMVFVEVGLEARFLLSFCPRPSFISSFHPTTAIGAMTASRMTTRTLEVIVFIILVDEGVKVNEWSQLKCNSFSIELFMTSNTSP